MQKVTLEDLREISKNCEQVSADTRNDGDEELADVVDAFKEYVDLEIQERQKQPA